MGYTKDQATGIVAAVQRDHREIEEMFAAVEDAPSGPQREAAWTRLTEKLEAHETAEERLVHPLTKEAGAEAVADEVEAEENQSKKAIAKFDGVDLNTAEFDERFQKLKADVKAHAEHEERDEHPRIMATASSAELNRLEGEYEDEMQKSS